MLIDTPGMRELGLLDDIGGVETSFADVAAFAERCRFRDCAHESEPGCAVLGAVASGELPAERLASYRKLLKEIAAARAQARSDPRGAHEGAVERNSSRDARAREGRPEAEARQLVVARRRRASCRTCRPG